MRDFNEFEKLIDEKSFLLLREGLSDANPADVASMIEELHAEKTAAFFRIIPKNLAAEVFAHLSPETQQALIERLSGREIFDVIEELFVDDAADFIEEMPAQVAKKVLAHATPETREQINRILRYPENSAGTIMTVEYVDLKRNMTVAQAFDRIRKTGLDKETIYTCYVTDSERKLKGIVSVRTLLLAQPDDVIKDVMNENLIITHTDADQEEVARIFDKYDLLNIPVIDSEDRLVGIITIDDIVDVVREEATEDFEIMAAMTPSEKPYLKTSVFRHFYNRIRWLVILMLSGMLTGFILGTFEDAMVAVPLLVTFIPMLTGTGGNAGSQSSTLVIRGMAVSEITSKDFLKVAWKEFRVSILVGIVLSIITFGRVMLFNSGDAQVYLKALVIALSLIFTVCLAKLCGGMLPMLAKRFNIDPAVMAAPLITTIVDALSLIMFFSIAKLLLGI